MKTLLLTVLLACPMLARGQYAVRSLTGEIIAPTNGMPERVLVTTTNRMAFIGATNPMKRGPNVVWCETRDLTTPVDLQWSTNGLDWRKVFTVTTNTTFLPQGVRPLTLYRFKQ